MMRFVFGRVETFQYYRDLYLEGQKHCSITEICIWKDRNIAVLQICIWKGSNIAVLQRFVFGRIETLQYYRDLYLEGQKHCSITEICIWKGRNIAVLQRFVLEG